MRGLYLDFLFSLHRSSQIARDNVAASSWRVAGNCWWWDSALVYPGAMVGHSQLEAGHSAPRDWAVWILPQSDIDAQRPDVDPPGQCSHFFQSDSSVQHRCWCGRLQRAGHNPTGSGVDFGKRGRITYVWWAHQHGPVGSGLGKVLLLGSILSFAVAVNLIRILSVELPGQIITTAMLGVGGLLLSALARREMVTGFLAVVETPQGVMLLLFELVVTTAIGYFLNVEALRRLSISKTTSFAYFQPPIAAVLVWGIGGEAPGWSAVLCFTAVLAANFLVLRSEPSAL